GVDLVLARYFLNSVAFAQGFDDHLEFEIGCEFSSFHTVNLSRKSNLAHCPNFGGNYKAIEKVSKEIKVYTEDEHIEKGTEKTKELYETLKNAILNLDELELKPKKKYIAFVSGSNVVDIHIQKNALKIWLNLQQGDLDDPKEIARDVSSVGHWGNGDYEIVMRTDEEMEYILSLIKQSLKKNKK